MGHKCWGAGGWESWRAPGCGRVGGLAFTGGGAQRRGGCARVVVGAVAVPPPTVTAAQRGRSRPECGRGEVGGVGGMAEGGVFGRLLTDDQKRGGLWPAIQCRTSLPKQAPPAALPTQVRPTRPIPRRSPFRLMEGAPHKADGVGVARPAVTRNKTRKEGATTIPISPIKWVTHSLDSTPPPPLPLHIKHISLKLLNLDCFLRSLAYRRHMFLQRNAPSARPSLKLAVAAAITVKQQVARPDDACVTNITPIYRSPARPFGHMILVVVQARYLRRPLVGAGAHVDGVRHVGHSHNSTREAQSDNHASVRNQRHFLVRGGGERRPRIRGWGARRHGVGGGCDANALPRGRGPVAGGRPVAGAQSGQTCARSGRGAEGGGAEVGAERGGGQSCRGGPRETR